jgi:hypothetical protein
MNISQKSSYRNQAFAILCGPIFTVFTLVGWFGFSQGLFPAHADWTAAQTAQFFADHQYGVELGCSIWIIGCCVLGIWVAQLSAVLARMEGGMPVWAIVQGLAGGGIVVLVMLSCCLWTEAAYRTGANADVIVSANDSAWLAILQTWPILSLEMIATAVVMLQDRRAVKMIPQWLSYASIAGAIVLIPAGGPAFTKSGTFAFHGFLGYFLPMIIWGLWFDSHSVFMWKALRREIYNAATPGPSPCALDLQRLRAIFPCF